MIRFRQITITEGPKFFELRRSAILAGCAQHYSANLLETWTNPLTDGALADHPLEHFYFAEIDDEIGGSGMVNLRTERIDAVFVHPRFFRRGVGAAIVRYLEHIAASNGLRHLALDATLNSIEFYRSLGFEGSAIGTFTSPRGLSLPCMPMSKRLTQSMLASVPETGHS